MTRQMGGDILQAVQRHLIADARENDRLSLGQHRQRVMDSIAGLARIFPADEDAPKGRRRARGELQHRCPGATGHFRRVR